MDRRDFLRGSAIFAAVAGLTVLPAFAQAPPPDKEKDKDKEKNKEKAPKKLIDKEGREYRVCPQCGWNMYKQKNLWVCENCGYSYVE